MDIELKSPTMVIDARNIVLRRGRDTLLKGLNWQVEKGQHWAILGPNGTGKTLFMKLLTGYLWPTDGTISILGHTLGQIDLRTLRRRLGWVAKALEELTPPHASVLKVILSGPDASLGLYREPAPEEIAEAMELAEEFGLERIVRREFGLLSSGEKQRVLLARAALAKPDILFLDEPMSNLDMGGRELFLALLDKLAERPGGPTIILTTHNTLEIGSFMTHALLLKTGEVVAAGLLEEVLSPGPLSKAFGLPLKVERTPQGRYLAYL